AIGCSTFSSSATARGPSPSPSQIKSAARARRSDARFLSAASASATTSASNSFTAGSIGGAVATVDCSSRRGMGGGPRRAGTGGGGWALSAMRDTHARRVIVTGVCSLAKRGLVFLRRGLLAELVLEPRPQPARLGRRGRRRIGGRRHPPVVARRRLAFGRDLDLRRLEPDLRLVVYRRVLA